jgi:hypothetical protein
MPERKWTEDHGAPGLRRKFDVYKPAGAYDTPNPELVAYTRSARLGADGEFVFVLRPETDACAWLALREYAHEVVQRDPELARDIKRELARVREANRAASRG